LLFACKRTILLNMSVYDDEMASPAFDHTFEILFKGDNESLIYILNCYLYPAVVKEDCPTTLQGEEEMVRAVDVVDKELVGSNRETKTLRFDKCCIAEAYSKSRTRSGKGVSKFFVVDFEMQRYGSLEYHQRVNVYAQGLFHENMHGDDYMKARKTHVLSFILHPHSAPCDAFVYVTKPFTFYPQSGNLDLEQLLRGKDVTKTESVVQSTQCVFFQLSKVEESFFTGTPLQQFLAFLALEHFFQRKPKDPKDKDDKNKYVFIVDKRLRFTNKVVLSFVTKMRDYLHRDYAEYILQAEKEDAEGAKH